MLVDPAYASLIEEKQAKMVTPPSIIQNLVKDVLAASEVSLIRLFAGLANEVYEAKTAQKDVIVRISHGDVGLFDQENWAIHHCIMCGIPVAKSLYSGTIQTESGIHSVCILEKLVGQPLNYLVRLHAISDSDLETVLREAGMLMARFATIHTQGFGTIDGFGRGAYKNFSELVQSKLQLTDLYKRIADAIGLSRYCISSLLIHLENTKDIAVQPRLQHGDLTYKHIFVDGSKVTGFIDWGNTLSADPLYDLAWWKFHKGDEGFSPLYKGYLSEHRLTQVDEVRFNQCLAFIALDFLVYYARHFPQGLDAVAIKLRGVQKFFELL